MFRRLSVCLLGTTVSPANTAEPIDRDADWDERLNSNRSSFYTVRQKDKTLNSSHNFPKCQPIFKKKILLLADHAVVNLQQTHVFFDSRVVAFTKLLNGCPGLFCQTF